MERISTRCGFCGRQTVTRHGRCPDCGRRRGPPRHGRCRDWGRTKRPPAPMPEPPAPPSIWREMSAQIGAAALAVLLVVVALVVGSTFLLYVGLLFLCAIVVILVVA